MSIELHDKPCCYCGDKINSLAANPGLWGTLAPPVEPGVVRYAHVMCLWNLTRKAHVLEQALIEAAEALWIIRGVPPDAADPEFNGAINRCCDAREMALQALEHEPPEHELVETPAELAPTTRALLHAARDYVKKCKERGAKLKVQEATRYLSELKAPLSRWGEAECPDAPDLSKTTQIFICGRGRS